MHKDPHLNCLWYFEWLFCLALESPILEWHLIDNVVFHSSPLSLVQSLKGISFGYPSHTHSHRPTDPHSVIYDRIDKCVEIKSRLMVEVISTGKTGNEEWKLMGTMFLFRLWKCSKIRLWQWLYNYKPTINIFFCFDEVNHMLQHYAWLGSRNLPGAVRKEGRIVPQTHVQKTCDQVVCVHSDGAAPTM